MIRTVQTHLRFPFRLPFDLLVATALLAACDDATPADPAPSIDASTEDAPPTTPDAGSEATKREAIALFWEAFHGEQYARIPEVAAALTAASDESPDDPELALLSGHVNLWRLAEWDRDPDQSPADRTTAALAALQAFQRAKELAPDDGRIPCWLGNMQVNVGRATGNEELVRAGIAEVADGVARFPEFNLFCEIALFDGFPRESEEFERAVEAMWSNLEACTGEEISRTDPTYRPYLRLETTEGPKRVCWNPGDQAPYNFEGFFLRAGDLMVKAGELEAARTLYENTMLLDFGSWPHVELLEERITTIDSRAAAYADEDPDNDPPVGGGSLTCAVCHAK